MQEINGEKILLNKDMPPTISLLLVLYSNNGFFSGEEARYILSKYYKLPNISMAVRNTITERKVHKDKNNVLHTTETGNQYLEEKLTSLHSHSIFPINQQSILLFKRLRRVNIFVHKDIFKNSASL